MEAGISRNMRLIYFMLSWFFGMAFLLVLLDELGLGEVMLAGIQAAIIWGSGGSNTGWLILICTVVPVSLMLVLGFLSQKGFLKLIRDLAKPGGRKRR